MNYPALSYLSNNVQEWRLSRLKEKGYGKENQYHIGDLVDYGSFWFLDPSSVLKNEFVEIKCKIIKVNEDKYGKRYELKYLDSIGYNFDTTIDSLKYSKR